MYPFLQLKIMAPTRRISHRGFSLIVWYAVSFSQVLLLMKLLCGVPIVQRLGGELFLIPCSGPHFFFLSHLCSVCLFSSISFLSMKFIAFRATIVNLIKVILIVFFSHHKNYKFAKTKQVTETKLRLSRKKPEDACFFY